jgi:protein-disulfide isomerase
MNKTKWIIFIVAALVIFGGLVWVSKSNQKTFNGDASKIIKEGPIADHTTGDGTQKVIFIEYADYQCPGCGKFSPLVKQISDKYKDKVAFVFRNMPLTNIHPNALAAATYAEAAGLQGKYYEMHDILYSSQESWSELSTSERGKTFEGYASAIGLNIDKLKQDLTSDSITQKIDRDMATAQKFGVVETPTFIVNGEKISSDKATDAKSLEKVITDAISKAYPSKK